MTSATKLGAPRLASATWVLPRRLILLVALTVIPATAHPQGCTQCRDNTAATSPATQSAYRQAILFLVASAGSIFVATLLILKRHR